MEHTPEKGGVVFVPHAEAQAEVERLLSDRRFRVSDRNRAFLRYLAEAGFAGQSSRVKGYAVAVDVFGRPATFDQNTDPIVRIEAVRVRAALDLYYDAFGHETSVRTTLPSGGYALQFQRTADFEACDEASEAVALLDPSPTGETKIAQRLEFLGLYLGALVVIAGGVLLTVRTF